MLKTPDDKLDGVVVEAQMSSELFAGPLPHPKIFWQYEQILPGAADRILKMAERQSVHRQGIERFVVVGDLIKETMGTVLAYIAFGGSMVGAVILLLNGQSVEGLTAFVVALGSAFGPKIFNSMFRKIDPSVESTEVQ